MYTTDTAHRISSAATLLVSSHSKTLNTKSETLNPEPQYRRLHIRRNAVGEQPLNLGPALDVHHRVAQHGAKRPEEVESPVLASSRFLYSSASGSICERDPGRCLLL